MENYSELISTLALTLGASWASGINLYAVLLVIGLGGATGAITLPEGWQVVTEPSIIAAAAIMFVIEFFVDKTPAADSGWDALHTFIRIPAGALLAAGAVGDIAPSMEIAAGILGGSVTAVTHATKAGSRALINTSPEPFSNWGASLAEDIAVFGGLWAALNHPLIFIGALVLFLLMAIWLLPKLLRTLARMLSKIGQWLGLIDRSTPPNAIAETTESDKQNAKTAGCQVRRQT